METDRKAWHAKVHGVAKSQTQLSKWTTTSPTCPAPVGNSSQHTWCCQGPRNPSSCTTSTPSPHWGRRKSSSAASGANSMDDSHTEVGEKPHPNSRGSVAKKEDQNHLHELYKLIKPTWSTWQTLCLSQSQFSRSVMSNSATPWTAAHQASLPITNSQGLLKLMSIESLMPCDHLILCNPLLLLPSVFPSIRIFSNELTLCNKGQSIGALASVSILPKEYSGLISFKIDWLDLLAVQGTLKSLLQHHSSKAPILQCSAFFILQLSNPYMTTGKP